MDWLENMYNRAVSTDADAVIPDLVFFHEIDSWRNRSLIGVHGNRDIQLSNREAVLLSLDWVIPGNALWKTALIKKIGYYDFGMYADGYTARVFFYNCNKVAFSKWSFFYRQDNPQAITKKLSYKTFDLPYTDFRLFQFLKDNNFQTEVQEKMLMREVSNLIGLKASLMEHNLLPFSKYALDGAEERIKKCFLCFKDDAVFKVLKKQKGFKNIIKASAVMGNYGIFSFVCFGFTILKLIKRIQILLVNRFFIFPFKAPVKSTNLK